MKIFDTRNMPWPSETPRNFAEEPATWYVVTPAMASIGTNDFEWVLDSQWLDASGGGGVFYNNTGTPGYNTIGWYIYSSDVSYSGFISHTGLVSNPVETYYNNTITGTNVQISSVRKTFAENTTRIVVKIKRVGATVSIYVNSILAKTITGSAPIALTNTSSGALRSSDSCNIYSVYLRNDTTGKTIWSYPTWYEEKRLLTCSNTIYGSGYWGLAVSGSGTTMSIKTPVRLAGMSLEKTFIFDIELPVATDIAVYEGICQNSNITNTCFSMTAKIGNLSVSPNLQINFVVTDGNGTNTAIAKAIMRADVVSIFGARTIITVTISKMTNLIRVYFGGIAVGMFDISSVSADRFADFGAADIITLGSSYVASACKVSQIYRAQIYDYAMTAAEIAAFN